MPQLGVLGADGPWVILHADVGPITIKEVLERPDVSLNIGSTFVGTGIDYPGIEIVVILEPQTEIDDLVQIFGRSGRMTPQGVQTKCVCYLVFNNSDISDNKPGMTDVVRNYCKNSTICRKGILEQHYGCDRSASEKINGWCCDVCLK